MFTGRDDFAEASRRHLADARALLSTGRWDGAVHLAGFAAECALKHALARPLGASFQGRDYGHDLDNIAGPAWGWVWSVTGDLRLHGALQAARRGPVAHHHPDRRYWGQGWSAHHATEAVSVAGSLVEAEVLADVLDHGLPWGVD